MWDWLRLFLTDVGLRLFHRDVGQLAPISDRCGTACAYLRQILECLRLFEADVGMQRLFETDVGMLAPISGRCGTVCAYLR